LEKCKYLNFGATYLCFGAIYLNYGAKTWKIESIRVWGGGFVIGVWEKKIHSPLGKMLRSRALPAIASCVGVASCVVYVKTEANDRRRFWAIFEAGARAATLVGVVG